MYLGQMMELAPTEELFQNPLHPYTQALLSSIPIPAPEIEKKRERIVLKGEIPNPLDPPRGCPFSSRCPFVHAICLEKCPPLRQIADKRLVACHLVSLNSFR